MKKIEHKNEFIFALYISMFVLIKPVTYKIGNSFLILLGMAISLIFISIVINKAKFSKKNIIGFLIIYIMIFILLIDILFRLNNKTMFLIKEFCIYGVIPIYLYSFTKNKERILCYFTNFAICIFVIYFFDPLQNYRLSDGYMPYGFNVILPTFMSLHIGRAYLNRKKLFILEIISFIQMCIFANKGSILTAIIGILIIYISVHKISINQIVKYIIGIFILCTISLNIVNIIDILIDLADMLNFDSYSLMSLKRSFTVDIMIGFSGRDQIWDDAWNFIKNNLVIGKGIGAFYSYYNYYSHNFIIDIIIYYGIIGIIVFCGIWIKGILKLFSVDYYEKIFIILILLLWIVPLSTSAYIFKNMYFWIFIAIAFMDNNRKIINVKA